MAANPVRVARRRWSTRRVSNWRFSYTNCDTLYVGMWLQIKRISIDVFCHGARRDQSLYTFQRRIAIPSSFPSVETDSNERVHSVVDDTRARTSFKRGRCVPPQRLAYAPRFSSRAWWISRVYHPRRLLSTDRQCSRLSIARTFIICIIYIYSDYGARASQTGAPRMVCFWQLFKSSIFDSSRIRIGLRERRIVHNIPKNEMNLLRITHVYIYVYICIHI